MSVGSIEATVGIKNVDDANVEQNVGHLFS